MARARSSSRLLPWQGSTIRRVASRVDAPGVNGDAYRRVVLVGGYRARTMYWYGSNATSTVKSV